jgi:glutamate/tyrosine decarboxylase-like PLP-dependent enzyme
MAPTDLSEETLDPQDWQPAKQLGAQMISDMLNYLQTVRERKVWQQPTADAINFLRQPVPQQATAPSDVYNDFKKYILPFPTGNIHPRFWGWVMGNGTATAMLADMLASGMNINQGGGNQIGGHVEKQVVDWFKEIFSFPADASGIITSGGSMANLVCLNVARHAKADFDLRQKGIYGSSKRMMIYASAQVHNCVNKSVELLGLGEDSLRLIETNDAYEIDLEQLKRQVKQDKANGLQPFCVIGNAVTVNTGACDDLNALADFCEQENLWFHVDGAIGALLVLSDPFKHLVRGIERADSIAFDLHKWMYLPYEAGCSIVRKGKQHYQAFSLHADYLKHEERGLAAGEIWFSDYGVELSRGFKALKIWMSVKEHGIKKFGRLITQNVHQVQYLKKLIEENPKLELVAPAPVNICCFRYKNNSLNDEQLNKLNHELLLRLHESGVALPTYATLKRKYAIRVANTNHRSRKEDFELLVNKVTALGDEILETKAIL